MIEAIIYSFLAGTAIPAGGAIAAFEKIRPHWLEKELRHTIIAFGGGALIAAVALVLVPEGISGLPGMLPIPVFLAGGFTFFLLDRKIAQTKGQVGQFTAMLLDYLPEAAAMGASFAIGGSFGPLLAFLIGMQNLPEGFNAFREIKSSFRITTQKTLLLFMSLPFLGPVAALVGLKYISQSPYWLSVIMLFSAGGILYLTFQDIAPRARLEKHWGPSLGAVAGFVLGMMAKILSG